MCVCGWVGGWMSVEAWRCTPAPACRLADPPAMALTPPRSPPALRCCADHDFLLSRDDLLRYSNHALTYRIVDRVFAQVGTGDRCRPFFSAVQPALRCSVLCSVGGRRLAMGWVHYSRGGGLRAPGTNARSSTWRVQVARPFTSGTPGRMGYEDFVWFILSGANSSFFVVVSFMLWLAILRV